MPPRLSKDEYWFLACHEFGHAAIQWHFCAYLDEGGVSIEAETGRAQFHVFCAYAGNMVAECLRNSHDPMAKALFVRDVERTIIRLLGGPVAESIAHGWGVETAIRCADEYRDPNSDTFRIRDLLRGLTGKDDKKYQLRLQDECKAILTEERTWRAIQHLSNLLLDHGAVSADEIVEVFRTYRVPRTAAG